jgi:hypothetical protein
VPYQCADFAPLGATKYGMGFHWTTWTMPRTGEPVSFPEAVEAFDVPALVDLAQRCGAGHVLFPANHAKFWLPGPNPELDRILPGRTCERDLLGEIADALAAVGLPLIVYYHHGTDLKGPGLEDDQEWAEACGAFLEDQTTFYDNYCAVLGWMGEHYGPKIRAWWFDAGYGLERRSVPPWERLSAVAKAGYPDRLVTYNAGVEKYTLYTSCQDYWAGELLDLNFRPQGALTPEGLPWYSFTSWATMPGHPGWGVWGMDRDTRDLEFPPPSVDAVAAYLEGFWAVGGAVSFNLLCYQDGTVADGHAEVLEEIRRRYR